MGLRSIPAPVPVRAERDMDHHHVAKLARRSPSSQAFSDPLVAEAETMLIARERAEETYAQLAGSLLRAVSGPQSILFFVLRSSLEARCSGQALRVCIVSSSYEARSIWNEAL